MTITEYADCLNVNIELTYYHNQQRYTASFVGAEVAENSCLISAYGKGITPNEALLDYVKRIKGKTLVFDAYKSTRREYQVPTTITVNTNNGMFS